MTRTAGFATITALLAFLISPTLGNAQEPMARMTDKDVKSLVKAIGDQQKKFARSLDSTFKRSIARGPGGEIEVAGYLDDLEQDIKRFADRFDGKYSASAEIKDLLTRANMMNGYIHNNPSMKGANEWDVFGSSLQRLAGAYGTTFPLPDDAVIRRIGDGELVDAGNALNKLSRDFRSTVRKSTRGMKELSEPSKSLEDELSSLADYSKTLASRIRSGKPASAEARQLMDSVGKIDSLVNTPGMPAEVLAGWDAGSTSVDKIAQAFGL